MRLRNVKGAREKISESPFAIQQDTVDGALYKGRWRPDAFENGNPIHMEIGMGKGHFITSLAEKNPDINYIGIEKYSSVLARALEKREKLEIDNLLFLRMDAENITDFFGREEIGRIYLNFPDPWPKERHAGRRLTSRRFLARYDEILAKDGYIQLKTDSRALFDFSVGELDGAGWIIDEINYDLHKNGPAADNVMTEYESKFYSLGNPIFRLLTHKK